MTKCVFLDCDSFKKIIFFLGIVSRFSVAKDCVASLLLDIIAVEMLRTYGILNILGVDVLLRGHMQCPVL